MEEIKDQYEKIITFYFRSTPRKMIIFDGMTSDEILDALCRLLNLPHGTLLICRNADGIEVPLTSKMPNGYMVHVQLRAALTDISEEIVSSLSIWDLGEDRRSPPEQSSGEKHCLAIQMHKKKLNKIKCVGDWPHFAKTSMGISDEGNLHRWVLKLTGVGQIYNHFGVSSNEHYYNPRTSLLPMLNVIPTHNAAHVKSYNFVIEVILDLRTASRADGNSQRGLWLKIADACIYHSPLFGCKPSVNKPWFLCLWSKSTGLTAKIIKYERDIPVELIGAHKTATNCDWQVIDVASEILGQY